MFLASKAAAQSWRVGREIQALVEIKPDLRTAGLRAYEAQILAQLLAINLRLPGNLPFVVSNSQARALHSPTCHAQGRLRQSDSSLSPVPRTFGPFKLSKGLLYVYVLETTLRLGMSLSSNLENNFRWLPLVLYPSIT